jgi:uncharacterized membrane protein YphA (DoxX/SURF4 family)
MADLTLAVPASRSRTIAYWIATVLVASEFALGGVWDLLRIPYVSTIMAHLGYPSYFAIFMGVWKVPGSVVMVLPRLPRLKEWVYAGMVYEMTGAVFSHGAVGDGVVELSVPVVLLGLIAVSWALRPPDRRDFARVSQGSSA